MIWTNGRHPYITARRPARRAPQTLLRSIRHRGRLLLFCLLFAAGLVGGLLLAPSFPASSPLNLGGIAEVFLTDRLGQTASETFLSSFYATLIFLVLLFFLGFCAVSAPLILAIPLFHGLGLGASMGHLMMYNGTPGMILSLAILLPPALIRAFAVCSGCGEAFGLSLMLLSAITSEAGRGGMAGRSKRYCRHFLLLVLLAACGALLDVILLAALAGSVVL